MLATPATIDLLHARGHKAEAVEFAPEGVKIKLLNAGHVLGSAQLLVETDGKSFCYSGDFKLEDSLTLKGAEIPQCDSLVMEATYGHPRYSFPNRLEVCQEIATWTKKELGRGRSVVLGGYSLGKAQEMVKLCNEFLGVSPLVSDSIHAINQVYKSHGVPLEWIHTESDEAQKLLERHEAFVAILPSNQVSWNLAATLEKVHGRKFSTAVGTGWALDHRFTGVDKAFCLSDHADFNQLAEYAERSGAKQVYCAFGKNEELAAHLREKGIDAKPLEEAQGAKGQQKLHAFAQTS